MTNKKVDARFRNFGCVVYPESAPDGWIDVISDLHVPAFISPLHDQDIDPQNQPKKPHFHVMVMYEGKKSIEQMQEVFASFGGVGCERINSIRGYARYLCHLDNPEKAQYNPEDIRAFAGADYFGICSLAIDKYSAIGEMMDYCILNDMYSYKNLLLFSRDNRYDWYRILCDNGTVVMREFLKSAYFDHRQVD